ncbi:tetratricopeptide repeat protein [Acidobacteriia bacterium AH_259_A11_L15]|nr:tetratricopeptide repeat protein [Acidobacteriia bacterium AH_259_A11_L15]
MLNEDGSLSGHEHNRFYLNLGNGTFVDASSVVGLDFDRDGRVFASVDFDNDGDLDLVLKNRNSPQLMVLRNDFPTPRHGIAFELVGQESNRDAVGAVVAITTSRGSRRKVVSLGSGFLSQSTRRVYFGLGAESEVKQVTIRWPSGRQQRLGPLPVDRLITVYEGESRWHAQTFLQPTDYSARIDQRASHSDTESSPSAENWLVEPVPAPTLAGKDLEGNDINLADWAGRPVLLNFWASWCVPCQEELHKWAQEYPRIRATGAEVLAVSVDELGSEEQVREFVRAHQLPFPVLLPSPTSVHAYNILHRSLLVRRVDLGVPTTFLIDADGNVQKLYRGITDPGRLLQDLQNMPRTPEQRLAAALPYPGRHVRQQYVRDYFALGTAFLNGQLNEEAERYLWLAVERTENPKPLINLGALRAQAGRPAEAIELLETAARYYPENPAVHHNLGVAYLQSGRFQQALAALRKAVELDPGFADAYVNLGLVYDRLGQREKAIDALQKAVRVAPNDGEAYDYLGVLHASRGELDEALYCFERAVKLSPANQDVRRHLGMVYVQKGLFYLAAETLEPVVEHSPEFPDTAVLLALSYYRLGKMDAARQLLEKVLQSHPHHSRAGELLNEINRIDGGH